MQGQLLRVEHDQTAKKDGFHLLYLSGHQTPARAGKPALVIDNQPHPNSTTTSKTHSDLQAFTTTQRHPWTFRSQSWAFSLLCKNRRLPKTSFHHNVLNPEHSLQSYPILGED